MPLMDKQTLGFSFSHVSMTVVMIPASLQLKPLCMLHIFYHSTLNSQDSNFIRECILFRLRACEMTDSSCVYTSPTFFLFSDIFDQFLRMNDTVITKAHG